ncbi:MAG: hypothetical protein AMXMBFR36_28820 [Acidobacteriota bacterium]
MICQFCEIEYPEGTERCEECGSDLVNELPPASSEIVLEPLVEVTRRRELPLLVERLEAAGIPYLIQSGTALRMLESQTLVNAVRGSEWEARVLVVSSRDEEAREIVREVSDILRDEPEDDD